MTVDTLPKQAFAVNNNLIDKGLLLLLLLFYYAHLNSV